MSAPVDLAEIYLWDTRIGAVAWERDQQLATFEYDPDFLSSGIEVAPLTMPLAEMISGGYSFPDLRPRTFHGLPGLLADTLPDRFGNLLINRWLAEKGRPADDFSPVERLCYQGTRGMGALEFKPSLRRGREVSEEVDVAGLVGLANQVLAEREELRTDRSRTGALEEIIRVGTSAGGARAKAVVAWNEVSGELRSGQVAATEDGFSHWLLKFDGVEGNRDKELADPQGYGQIEYAYYLMARAAGLRMERCELLREGGRSHFMTRRFDRPENGDKVHMLSLCGMAHYDFNLAGAYGYEQALAVMRRLDLSKEDLVEQFRRACFNVLARNQDDHTKNIAFLMDRRGQWRLSPAYDVTYAYNPEGEWTGQHQMSVNGKRRGFTKDDLREMSRAGNLSLGEFRRALEEVEEAVSRWKSFAENAGLEERVTSAIGRTHRML